MSDKITDGQYLDALSLIRKYQEQIKEEIEIQTLKEREFNNKCLSTDFEFNWDSRSKNALKRNEVNTVGDLKEYSLDEFYRFRNMGRKSIGQIESFLVNNGITLKQ